MSAVPQLRFVIPVLDEAERIGVLLDDLRERFPSAEIVVVDGGSADATVELATPRCHLLLSSPPGRAAQMNLGAHNAHGDYVFFLHADTAPLISESQLLGFLADSPAWGFSRVRLGGARTAFRVIEWFINRRSALTAVGTGDQMLFVRTDVFIDCGGYRDMPLMEDVELCKRLRRSTPPRILQPPVVTSSRRWEQGGVVRTVVRMWCLRMAYVLGVSPHRLWHHYYGAAQERS